MKLSAVAAVALLALVSCEKQSGFLRQGLDTSLRPEDNGGWDSGIEALDIEWRFLSHRPVSNLNQIQITGTYRIRWRNTTDKKVTVNYGLRFQDADGFEIARTGSFEFRMVHLEPKESQIGTKTFNISIDNLQVANQIKSMILVASFSE